MVTVVEVIIKNFLSEVRIMLPRGQRAMATFLRTKGKNVQWWPMTLVTICFVIPQNEDKTFKQKSYKHKSFDDFTVIGQHFTW